MIGIKHFTHLNRERYPRTPPLDNRLLAAAGGAQCSPSLTILTCRSCWWARPLPTARTTRCSSSGRERSSSSACGRRESPASVGSTGRSVAGGFLGNLGKVLVVCRCGFLGRGDASGGATSRRRHHPNQNRSRLPTTRNGTATTSPSGTATCARVSPRPTTGVAWRTMRGGEFLERDLPRGSLPPDVESAYTAAGFALSP